MAKKKVSKCTFYAATLSYHLLCVAGLMWQVTQISINFFTFDVIKDINVVLPEESKKLDLMLNVCFDNAEVFDDRKYFEYFFNQSKKMFLYLKQSDSITKRRYALSQLMKLSGRFIITSTGILPRDIIAEFIVDADYCYQVNMEATFSRKKLLKNVNMIKVSMGEIFPNFDYQRLIQVSYLEWKNKSIDMEIRSFYYEIYKLEWPYIDDCIDYNKTMNLHSRLNAVIDCENNHSIRDSGMLWSEKMFEKNEVSRYQNFSLDYERSESFVCRKIYHNFDCEQYVHLTQATIKDSTYYNRFPLTISAHENRDPSFKIYSKPKIVHIDYFTYIFGALGTWLGFSFIAINPIPSLLEMNQTSLSNGIVSDEVARLIKIEANKYRLENISFRQKAEEEKRRIKLELQKTNEKVDRLIQEINRIKRSV